MPPSTDDQPGKKPPECKARRGGGRRPGKQPAAAAANKTIRAVIILARVVCGDETPLRVGPGPKSRKKYLQVACTNLLTYYFLGDRDLASFKSFVYSDLHGAVIVHDRYVNYDSFDGVSHQLCCQHYADTVVMPIPGRRRWRAGVPG